MRSKQTSKKIHTNELTKKQPNNTQKKLKNKYILYINTEREGGKPKCLPVQSFSINRKGFCLKDWPADVYDCRQFKGHAHAGFINQNTLKSSKKAYEDHLIQSAGLRYRKLKRIEI